jgi:hypothetical protein
MKYLKKTTTNHLTFFFGAVMELDVKLNSSSIANMNFLRTQNLLFFPLCLTNEVCNIIHSRQKGEKVH